MPELTDLLAVFGAVDQLVARNPQLGPEVAELLPPYGRGAAGWYDRLVAEPGPRRLSFVPPDVPSLEQALRNMSAEDSPRLTNRSLLGVAAYRRVRNAAGASLSDTDPLFVGDDVLAAALAPVLPAPVASGFASTYSTRLVELLGDPYVHRTLGSFDAVLAEAYRQELVSSFVARQMPVPMMWTVLPTTAGGGPALVFEVRLRVTAPLQANVPHAITAAKNILDPGYWTNFQPPWCTMASMPYPVVAVRRFLETVAWVCGWQMGDPGVIVTVLDFFGQTLPDGTGILEYRLVDDPAAGGDGQVTVDEGSLVVRPLADGAEVITTKRVQFRAFRGMGVAEAEMLAVLIWCMGYPSMAEIFVATLARDPSLMVTVVDPKPVGGGTILGPPVGGAGAGITVPQGPAKDVPTSVEGIVDECFSGLRSSASKIASGQYGPTAYLTDVLRLTRHLTKYGGYFLQMGSKPVSSGEHTPSSP